MNISIQITMKESKRYETARRLIDKKLTEEEARKMMELKSVRQVRRIKKRVMEEGIKGVAHRNRGRPGNRKMDEKLSNKIMNIIKLKYSDFRPTFAAEKLLENHGIKVSGEWLRKRMTAEKIWNPKSRKGSKKIHTWRARKDNFGEMQQFDGSYHDWFETGEEECLLAAIDDATGEITHAEFDMNEGVKAVFEFWIEYIEKNGLPLSIYLDKFSTYKINHPSAVDNKDLKTQFERAMNQVGIKLITAHSPEAKGRVERLFRTLQDRLVKELRLKKIKTIKEANEFLTAYIPEFNKKFAVVPAGKNNLHRAVSKETRKEVLRIFSIQSPRKVMNDYTVMFKNRYFQLEEKQPTSVFKKDTVIIEERLNGEIRINLKGYDLKYVELPERPKRQHIPVAALTRQRAPWTPPADHPWRNPFNYSKQLTT